MTDAPVRELSSHRTVYVKFGVVSFWVVSTAGMAGWLASAVVGPAEGLGALMTIGAVGLWATLGPGSLKTAETDAEGVRIGGFFRQQLVPYGQIESVHVRGGHVLPPIAVLRLHTPCHWGIHVRFLLPADRWESELEWLRSQLSEPAGDEGRP